MTFGKILCSDLDAIVRTVAMKRYHKRYSNPNHFRNARKAAGNLGWPIGLKEEEGCGKGNALLYLLPLLGWGRRKRRRSGPGQDKQSP